MTPTNLYEYYTQKGQKLPSVQQRAPIYEQYGLGKAGEYAGTAEQNIAFLSKLQAGLPTPAPTPAPVIPATPVLAAEPSGDYMSAMSKLAGMGMDPTDAAAMAMMARGGLEPGEEGYYKPLSERLPEELTRAETDAGVVPAKEKIAAVQGELTTLDEKIRDVEDSMARAEQAVSTSPYLTTSMISGKSQAIRREYGIKLSNLTKQRQIKANELSMATGELSRAESSKWKGFEALSQFARQGMVEETGREAMPYTQEYLKYQQEVAKQEFEQELALVRTKQAGTSGTDDTVGWSKYAAELGLVGMPYNTAMKEYGEYETNRSQGLAAVKADTITSEQYTSAMAELYPGKGEEIRTDLESQEPSAFDQWLEQQIKTPTSSWTAGELLPWRTGAEKASGTSWLRSVLPW